MKIMIEAFVTYSKWEWSEKPHYSLQHLDLSSASPSHVVIRKQAFEVEIPDDFDPRPIQINSVRDAKKRLLGEAEAAAANIDEQIQRLLCIEAPKQ